MRYFSKKFYSNFYQGFEVKKFVSVFWSRMKLRENVKKAHMIRFQAGWVLVIELQNNQLRYIHWNVHSTEIYWYCIDEMYVDFDRLVQTIP